MNRLAPNWIHWVRSLNSVDGPGRTSFHRFILSARPGLWPALFLSTFAFGHLLAYETNATLLIAIDLCFAASIAFLFNDIRDAAIDSANHIHRWSLKSRSDSLLFAAAVLVCVVAVLLSSHTLTAIALIGVIFAMALGLLYSIIFKPILLVGNLIAALLSISPGLIMFIDSNLSAQSTEGRPGIAVIFLLIAFLSLLSREIKFDEFDIVGDRVGHRTTVPMRLTPARLNIMHSVLLCIAIFLLFATIVLSGRFSLGTNLLAGLLTSGVGTILLLRAYLSSSKERFYKSTRVVLLVIPMSMVVSF